MASITVVSWTARHEDAVALMKRVNFVDCECRLSVAWITTRGHDHDAQAAPPDKVGVVLASGRARRAAGYAPAWDTERPASSISWSIEKAPLLMSSLSRAAAALAERVWRCKSVSQLLASEGGRDMDIG